MGDKWIIQQSMVNLGFSKLKLHEIAGAQDCFLRSLQMVSEAKLVPSILDSVAGIAWILARQGNEAGALEMSIVVEKHPAVTQETKDRAIHLKAELEAQLTRQQIEAAQVKAGKKTLEEIVREINLGW